MRSQILVIHGSPRINGNSSFLAKTALPIFDQNKKSYKEIFLASLMIRPCTACESCRELSQKYCIIDDDMELLYKDVMNATAILFATPIYWFTFSAQLKLFIDRLYAAFKKNQDFLKGVKVGVILTYGDSDIYTSGGINAIQTFEHMCRYLKANLIGFSYGTAFNKDDAQKNESLIQSTQELAMKLL